MRLTKIYTKIGDKGRTLLASGEKVSKTDLRIEAYGTVDELNSVMALLRDELVLLGPDFDDLAQEILLIQNELFDIGGELSTPAKVLNPEKQQVVSMDAVTRLERQIDAHNQALPELANFILPGGHRANSVGHLARTVCRRAERRVVAFAANDQCRPEPMIYLNRLSDWLFVLCRVTSSRLGLQEVLWKQKKK